MYVASTYAEYFSALFLFYCFVDWLGNLSRYFSALSIVRSTKKQLATESPSYNSSYISCLCPFYTKTILKPYYILILTTKKLSFHFSHLT